MRRALGVMAGLMVIGGVVLTVRAGDERTPAPVAARSPDESWQRMLTVPGAEIFDVAITSTTPSTVYAATSRGVYRSSNEGQSWSRILVAAGTAEAAVEEGAPAPSGSVMVIPSRPGLVFVALGSRLWQSEDDGRTWRRLPAMGQGAPAIRALRMMPGEPDHLYAATDAGVFRVPLPPVPPAGLERPAAPAGEAMPLPADGDDPVLLAGEPGIREVQAAAIRYAEVMPEKIRSWRTRAAWRAWVPHFTLDLDQDRSTTVGSSSSGGKTTFTVGPEDRSLSLGYGFTWDLADLIWNPDQTSIDTRSRLMVQLRQDILDDVTRLYFERRRLQVEYAALPVREATLQAERRVRLEELTAQLDGLTGGYFSEAIEGSGRRWQRSPSGG